MEVLARKSVKVKICAAPKRERSVEEVKRNQLFNPYQSTSKTKCLRRSDGNATLNTTKESFQTPPNHMKSISLPPSPIMVASNPSSNVSDESDKCSCKSKSSFSVSVNSENEKKILTKVRDELRNSPLLDNILWKLLSGEPKTTK